MARSFLKPYAKFMQYPQLLTQYPVISDQISKPALGVVLKELEKSLLQGGEGSIVEFGCYIGTTTLFLRRLLNIYQSDRKLYAYDSFEGLPPKLAHDRSTAGEQFKAGELAISKKQFLQEFRRVNLQPPITYKSWFKDLKKEQLPAQISYAFLDGDFYESIIDCLRIVWPRLSEKGTITIDDYQRSALPGVEAAVRDFFQDKSIKLRHEHNIAIIYRS